MPAWCNDPLCESTCPPQVAACMQQSWAAPCCAPCGSWLQAVSRQAAVRRDGRMDAAGPAPCAAVQGTTLVVEDLFYNMLTRKKAGLTLILTCSRARRQAWGPRPSLCGISHAGMLERKMPAVPPSRALQDALSSHATSRYHRGACLGAARRTRLTETV